MSYMHVCVCIYLIFYNIFQPLFIIIKILTINGQSCRAAGVMTLIVYGPADIVRVINQNNERLQPSQAVSFAGEADSSEIKRNDVDSLVIIAILSVFYNYNVRNKIKIDNSK